MPDRLTGDLDAASGAQVDAVVDELVGAGARDLVFDCDPLRFCDSHGLRSLVIAAQRAPGVVSLVRPPTNLRRVLDLTSTASLFEVIP